MGAVFGILGETGLAPRYLELEITESLLMGDVEASYRALNQLKGSAAGVRVSIDVFGTGYSSLSRLETFPIDLLKIDRSFIRDLVTDPNDAVLTKAIIDFAHELELRVVAEGVETAEQVNFLRARSCEMVQGYYFSRPLPPHEFVKLGSRERGAIFL